MAKGMLNKVFLIGNLGQDPDIRHSPGGTVVANLSVATTHRRKVGAQWEDHTEWHRVAVFGRTAETAREYLRKGSKVLVEGHLRTRKFQDKHGQDQYRYEIFVEDLQLMDRASGGGSPAGGASRSRDAGLAAAPPAGPGGGDYDDDIPF